MPPPIQTFTAEIHYSVIREMLAPTRRVQLGGGATGNRDRYERVVWMFRLHATHERQSADEEIYSFFLEHRGSIPFWFSGEKWGTVTTPIFVGWGTGSQTHLFSATTQHPGLPASLCRWDSGEPAAHINRIIWVDCIRHATSCRRATDGDISRPL